MKKIIILCGHGNYATGMQSTLELLAGKNQDLFFVNFTADDTDKTLKEKLEAIVENNKDSEILFVCDIIGGTPFKIAAEISNSSEKMELVVGCNIGGILEMIFMKEGLSLRELAENMVEQSKNSTIRFKKIDINTTPEINIPDEGGI
ncbi:MAG: system fructose subfamily component [Clostridiales bacterium]|jgi:PTS system N-acetylgalactosamine-specific IIA component|nr:system fructose subfamily component [Clostridiales bacterium]